MSVLGSIGETVNRAISGPDKSKAFKTHNKERGQYARLIRSGGYDPAEVADYERQGSAPVDAAEDATLSGVANAYARRGLASSPMAGAAGGDAVLQAATQRKVNSAQARNQGIANQRRRTLDQYGAETGQWNTANQIALTQVENQAAMEQAMWSALQGAAGEGSSMLEQEAMLKKLRGKDW